MSEQLYSSLSDGRQITAPPPATDFLASVCADQINDRIAGRNNPAAKPDHGAAEANSGDKTAGTTLPKLELFQPGATTEHTMKVDGKDAKYLVHVPPGCDASEKLPVVMVFHGYGNHKGQGDSDPAAKGMEQFSRYSELADKEKFIVVYPTGDPKDHYSFNNKQWWFTKRDDVQFTSAILDQVEQNANVDKERVYMVGYSQGASFVHRAAGEMSPKVAAIAEVGGWMTGKEKQAENNLPILSIHSDGDTHAPIKEPGRTWWLTMKPHSYVRNFYTKENGTAPDATVETFTGKNGEPVIRETFENPTTKAQVQTLYLTKLPHLWYGGKGADDAPVDATKETWEFLKQYRRGANKVSTRNPEE